MFCCFIILIVLLTPQADTRSPASGLQNGNQQSHRPLETPLVSPSPSPLDDLGTAQARAAKEQQAKEEAFRNEQLHQNGVIEQSTVFIAVFSGLSFLAVVAYAYTAFKQWKAIEKQAEHASAAVDKMQEQLEGIREQARIMNDSLAETRNIVTQNERAVAASERQASSTYDSVKAAERNADIALETFYIGESAYFGITGMKIDNVQRGQTPRVIVSFINGGRTPAWHFVAEVGLTVGQEPRDDSTWQFTYPPHISNSFFAAGTEKQLTFNHIDLVLSQEQLNAIFKDHTLRLFVFGSVRYIDVKRKRGDFTFCTVLDPPTGNLYDYEIT